MILKLTFLFAAFYSAIVTGQYCAARKFDSDSIVCECNSTYCDFYLDPKPLRQGEFISFTTSKSGKRLSRLNSIISNKAKEDAITIKVDPNKQYQKMEGFGGAFTDSAGININKLSEATRNNVLRSYFGSDGIKYNLGRVPIAGTDFSIRGYSYDDVDGDIDLKHFNLTEEDIKHKIPLMKQALKLNPSLRFLAASWTAPPWMKSSKKFIGFGVLLEEYYQTYANYIVKFLEEYQKEGLVMWTVSTGNEPATALIPDFINSMFWTPKTVSKWVIENLGPTIASSKSNKTTILLIDDQRFNLPWYVNVIKNSYKKVLDYVSGIGIHWYWDKFIPATVLDTTQAALPDKYILMTEACLASDPWIIKKVILGSWIRFDFLVEKMFENINHWVVGWVDWNLALDSEGGPNWVKNNVDSPIIIIPEKDMFYKQPLFYAIAHFSKFVKQGSYRIEINSDDESILTTAFKFNEEIVVILYNRNSEKKKICIKVGKIGYINMELPKYSLSTILYNI